MVTVPTKPFQENIQDKFDSNGMYKKQIEECNEDYIKRSLGVDGVS